jgi:hypothetical protein
MDAIEDLIKQEILNCYAKDDNHRGRDKRIRESTKRRPRREESSIRLSSDEEEILRPRNYTKLRA